MADFPILFSAPMVQALIAGRKTQTRRVLPKSEGVRQVLKLGTGHWSFSTTADGLAVIPPRIKEGDRLYVREAWRVSSKYDAHSPVNSHNGSPVLKPRSMTVLFEAGGSIANVDFPAHEIHTRPFEETRGLIPDTEWRPDPSPAFGEMPSWAGKVRQGMHLPRWASRITLVVTDVRVERLQDISEDDAIAEGVVLERYVPVSDSAGLHSCGEAEPTNPVEEYRELWDSINGPGSWDANPWVVAYSFTVHMGNIDDVRL